MRGECGKMSDVSPMDTAVYGKVRKNWDRVAKPLYSLGRFEDIIALIGAVQGTDRVDISKRAVVVMCSDNGIVDEGVSQSGREVTAEVAGWMGRGTSSVCRMASPVLADVIPVDIGMDSEKSPEGVIDRKIRRGTDDFLKKPAMTGEELKRAIDTGTDLVRDLKQKGYKILATGEMGIGNTTTSAAVCAGLMNLEAEEVTGRGAGLSDTGYEHKKEVINSAIGKYGFRDRYAKDREYTEYVLSCVGGFDIAGLAGVFIGGALYGVPVIVDGMISAAAALAAQRLLPGTKDVMIASHMGREAGMRPVLKELSLEPVIDAGMALGEGTGAVMLFPLLDMVLSLYSGGKRFEETPIEQYKYFNNPKI